MKRNISKAGIELIKSFEGLSLKACKCVSTEKYYTIGYGHYGKDVKAGQTITKEEAEKLLVSDLQGFVRKVNDYMPFYNFNQNEFDALVSFAYNVGNIKQLTNNGKRTRGEISVAMLHYNKSGGRVLNGLTKRRKAEQELFNKPVTKDLKAVAKEVIAGKWGTGEERKKKLTKAGYDYKAVQKLVNEMLKKG